MSGVLSFLRIVTAASFFSGTAPTEPIAAGGQAAPTVGAAPQRPGTVEGLVSVQSNAPVSPSTLCSHEAVRSAHEDMRGAAPHLCCSLLSQNAPTFSFAVRAFAGKQRRSVKCVNE